MRFVKSSAIKKILRQIASGRNKNVNKNTIWVTAKADSALKAILAGGGLIGLNSIENELLKRRVSEHPEAKQGRRF